MSVFGDINNDGIVSGADVVYLASYIAGLPGYTLTEQIPVSELNLSGVDVDGYLVGASGEAFNFITMYNSTLNEFDITGITPLKTFATDMSFGRFNVAITSPPPVTYLQLTGGHDIFTDRINKNTFKRVVLLSEGSDLSYVPVTPITTLVTEIFTKLCEEDISTNGTTVENLSFTTFLTEARTHVKKMLGPDFSGVNIADIEKDPYDELYKAKDANDPAALKFAKQLIIENMKLNIYINSCADNQDPNTFDEHKDNKYRRKIFKEFGRRMHRKWKENNTKDLDHSIEDLENDHEHIEAEAATESGTKRRGKKLDGTNANDGTDRRTNERFFRKMPEQVRRRKQELDTNNPNITNEDYIKEMIKVYKSFDELIEDDQVGIQNPKPKGKPDTDGEYNTDFDGKRNNQPTPTTPSGGWRPPPKHQ